MLVLHAAFRPSRLLVWAESSEAAFSSPREVLVQLGFTAPAEESITVTLPSVRKRPLPSHPLIGELPRNARPKLVQYTLPAMSLSAAQAIDLLVRAADRELLAPGVLAGADLRFWGAAMRFAASLVVRQQFLPDIVQEDGASYARWRAVFLGRTDERRQALVNAMPPAARACAPDIASAPLLEAFLHAVVDHLVRAAAPQLAGLGDTVHDRWVRALHSPDGKLSGDAQELVAQLREWRRPLAAATGAPFRLCFRLEEPAEESADPWRVRYLLQARHDPSLLISAGQQWPKALARDPAFRPREFLLASLGQAAAISPEIETSLKSPAPASYETDTAGAHEFLTTRAVALEEAGFGVMLPAWWSRKGTRARISAKAHVRSTFQKQAGLSMNEILDFEWQISIGGEKITLAELKALAKLKTPLVRFRGEWVQLNAEEIQAALEFWEKKQKTGVSARELVRIALGAARPEVPVEFEGVTAEGWIADLLAKLEGTAAFEELPPPAGLRATLRPYQIRGYSWLAFVRGWGLGACLADDMGLGKTIQTLSLILRDRQNNGSGSPVLLLCPTSVAGNWQKEAARFTPELPVLIHHGISRAKGDEFVRSAQVTALVISTYALVHRDFEHLRRVQWGGIVLDEAQNIKNAETKQAVAARSLEAAYRIALTGTPVENNVGDLWSVMEFLNPGLLGTRAEFRRNFYMPIEVYRDQDAAARLKKITGPFILRRLKTDRSILSDLPEKLEMKVFCTLTKEQATLYAAVVKESLREIEKEEGIKRKGIVLATLARLKQVCNHPAHYLADNSTLPGRSGKLARLTEMLEESASVGDNALVFTQFAEMGAMLQRHLQETFGREVLFLHGGVSKPARDRMVERFQSEAGGPNTFILSLKAGGTGLNLTRANHVFHFDRWWNPAVENQATDRAFRIGQTRNVQVHKFVCAGTLEEKIDGMIERKKEVAEGVVGTGEGWLTELSTAQLKSLFALDRSSVED